MSSPAEAVHLHPSSTGTEFSKRLDAVSQAKNPLFEAARVLLRAHADIPDLAGISVEVATTLRKLIEHKVQEFDRLCMQANIRRDHMIGARYCICTALDEAVMQSPWGKDELIAEEWAAKSLASTFLEDSKGGVKVYLLVGRLMADPQEHRDLLEVIFRILSCGFEGRYRGTPNGLRQHAEIRQRIYTEITSGREPVPQALSPHWKSDVHGPRMSFWEVPVWITATVLSVALLGQFGYYKYELSTRTVGVQKQIAEIGRMTPPPQAARPVHLRELLKNEIEAGTVSVNEDASRSAVTFRGDAMFQPGGAAVKSSMGPLITKIAGEIAKVPGMVSVLGYTDNIPIHSGQFASNQALSEERATQVMQMLQATGVPANRLEAVGKGEADPLGDNRTAQGRAQNRRVEIIVAQ